MVPNNDTEFRLNPNGHEDVEEETQEQLDTAFKTLSSLRREDGSLVTLTKQDMSLLKAVLLTSTEKYREQQMWRMVDFLDDDEAMDHVAAYYEAKELGMGTDFNVAYMFALCSANRKTNKSNLIAQILDTVQHGKWVDNNKGKKQYDRSNTGSPIGNG